MKRISVRLEDSEHLILMEEAKKRNMSMNDFIISLIKEVRKEGYLSNIEDICKKIYKTLNYVDTDCQITKEMLNQMIYNLGDMKSITDDKIKTGIYEASTQMVRKKKNAAAIGRSKNLY